ncbi:MAG: YeiH family protein [Candidatus Eremiobacteraeota bacterium]|nr:YeiH family protein [Candidatus Eremiobacteraeota bacterium]
MRGNIGTLIGAGTAICGGSAILAIGPILRAADEEIAYALTTIFAFNIVALLAYPPIGHALHLSNVAFGAWTGTAVNDTSVVVATVTRSRTSPGRRRRS